MDKNSVQEIFDWLESHFNSPGIFYKSSPIEAWLAWGADFEKDIKPAAILYSKKRPNDPPRCLSWLRDLITTSIKLRTEPMSEMKKESQKANYKETKPLSQAVYINIKKKISDGYTFVTPQERDFIREFEKQELRKVVK